MLRRVSGVLGLALALSVVPVVAAQAAPAPPAGHLMTIVQNTFEHRLRITGWAYDPAKASAAVTVKLYVDGKYAGHVRADDPSPNVDRTYHLTGAHGYSLTVPWTPTARAVTAKTAGLRAGAPVRTLATKAVKHYVPPAGTRIVVVAKRYVGKARYVEGGAGPHSFDCSGYTRYAYAQAHVTTLPHNAEAQRHVKKMHRISAGAARPGDLVFYLSGGSAYHVAIYAGHGMQYAAATPKDGIRYQKVWSRAVQYGTLTH